jgi:hypothetical protein
MSKFEERKLKDTYIPRPGMLPPTLNGKGEAVNVLP